MGSDRRGFLVGGLGAVAAGATGVLRPADARAATPEGDDIGWVQLAAAAKLVALACADRIGRRGLLADDIRRVTAAIRAADATHLNLLVPLLGEDAPSGEDYAFVFPARALRSSTGALQLMGGIERLAIGTLLGGVTTAADPGTRALLGGMAAADGTHLASLLGARGRPTVEARPARPLTIERASERLGRYLRTPGFDHVPAV